MPRTPSSIVSAPLADDSDPLLKAPACAALLNISLPSFWRRVADKTISKPIKIGRLSRWPASEIRAVIEHAKQERSE